MPCSISALQEECKDSLARTHARTCRERQCSNNPKEEKGQNVPQMKAQYQRGLDSQQLAHYMAWAAEYAAVNKWQIITLK